MNEDALSSTEMPIRPIRVRLVDDRPPFPDLGLLDLPVTPRAGEVIQIRVSTGLKANYKVTMIIFEPYEDVQIKIGVLPFDLASTPVSPNESEMKQKQEEVVKSNLQIFDRAQAYSNAIVVVGYAGAFGLWNFTRTILTERTTVVVGLMLGISLILYVTWEIYTMVARAAMINRFNQFVDSSTGEFFKRWDAFQKEQRKSNGLYSKIWSINFYPTILLAYVAGLLLMYNTSQTLSACRNGRERRLTVYESRYNFVRVGGAYGRPSQWL